MPDTPATLPALPEPDIEDFDYELWGQNAKANAWFEAKLRTYAQQCAEAARAEERERAARVCDDEARIREEAGNKHPEDSPSRDRCYAAARAATNCAKGIRSGEIV